MEQVVLKKIPISISPQKMNLMAGLIRKKSLNEILPILNFSTNKASKILCKLLLGIVKNLEKNNQEIDKFFLTKIEVNRGIIQKRVIFRAKGRSDRIRKRHTLLNVLISQVH